MPSLLPSDIVTVFSFRRDVTREVETSGGSFDDLIESFFILRNIQWLLMI